MKIPHLAAAFLALALPAPLQAQERPPQALSPEREQAFRAIDMDGDGRISRWEVARRSLNARFGEFDADNDGHIGRAEFARIPAATLAVPPGEASASAGAGRPRDNDATFRQLDRNGDGFLSGAELWSERGRRGDWMALDRDGDGRISPAEFAAVGR